MEIPKEKINELKSQIISQINSSLPEEQREPMIAQINSMNDEQFINFLKQNNIIDFQNSENSSQQSPFRLIVEEKIPCYKIDENKNAIAVLEINPISKAHTIIIPKDPIQAPQKIPKTIISLANKIANKIKTKFSPKDVLISSTEALGEIIINVLPIYTNETLQSSRQKAEPEELEKLKSSLEKKSKTKKAALPKIKKIDAKNIIIPRRIP